MQAATTIAYGIQSRKNGHDNFDSKVTVVSCFMEHNNKVLILQKTPKHDQPGKWGIPGGRVEGFDLTTIDALRREILEETQIRIDDLHPEYFGERYVRVPDCPDYTIHIYRLKWNEEPPVTLSEEHKAYEWVSLAEFSSRNLLKAQGAIFDEIYSNHAWRRVCTKNLQPAPLVLQRGDQRTEFSPNRRLFITLIGTTGVGKGTQGELIKNNLGIPLISIGDMFRDEIRSATPLGQMIIDHDAKYKNQFNPDELPLGMIAKRLADPDAANGCILDGFPRTPDQASVLLRTFLRPQDVHVPIFMDIADGIVKRRLEERFICKSCGWQKRAFDRLVKDGICPQDGGTLVKREADGNPEKLMKKFEIFNRHKGGILQLLLANHKDNVLSLEGSEPPSEVFTRIHNILNQAISAAII